MTDRTPLQGRPPSEGLALDTLARRVADELALLSGLSLGLQEALSRCRFASHPESAILAGLQGIDRISQGIDDLGRLMTALAEHLPGPVPRAPDRVLAPLLLRDLADRLAAREPTPPAPPCRRSGDVSWF